MKRLKKHISLFFLAITVSLTVNLHALSHSCEHNHGQQMSPISHHDHDHHNDSDDKETCELCIVSIVENRITTAIIPYFPIVTLQHNDSFDLFVRTFYSKEIIISKKLYKSDTFNKPPPSSIT